MNQFWLNICDKGNLSLLALNLDLVNFAGAFISKKKFLFATFGNLVKSDRFVDLLVILYMEKWQ